MNEVLQESRKRKARFLTELRQFDPWEHKCNAWLKWGRCRRRCGRGLWVAVAERVGLECNDRTVENSDFLETDCAVCISDEATRRTERMACWCNTEVLDGSVDADSTAAVSLVSNEIAGQTSRL